MMLITYSSFLITVTVVNKDLTVNNRPYSEQVKNTLKHQEDVYEVI